MLQTSPPAAAPRTLPPSLCELRGCGRAVPLRPLMRPVMRRLLSLCAVLLALVFGAAPSYAADAGHGAAIFSANCAACHMGGGNVVNAERTLKQDALEAYLTNYAAEIGRAHV